MCRNELKDLFPERLMNSFLSSSSWCIVVYEGSYLFNSLDFSLAASCCSKQILSYALFSLVGGHSDHKNDEQTSIQAGEDGRHKSSKTERVYQGAGSAISPNQHTY